MLVVAKVVAVIVMGLVILGGLELGRLLLVVRGAKEAKEAKADNLKFQ
jgi:hypothetical protein